MLAILLATAIISAYVGALALTVHTVVDGPAFNKSDRFDLRIDYGTHVRFIQAKPAPIVWEEPEPYFEVHTERRVVTGLSFDHVGFLVWDHTYKVERMGC